jgi:hypothetical protein
MSAFSFIMISVEKCHFKITILFDAPKLVSCKISRKNVKNFVNIYYRSSSSFRDFLLLRTRV